VVGYDHGKVLDCMAVPRTSHLVPAQNKVGSLLHNVTRYRRAVHALLGPITLITGWYREDRKSEACDRLKIGDTYTVPLRRMRMTRADEQTLFPAVNETHVRPETRRDLSANDQRVPARAAHGPPALRGVPWIHRQ
jgi:hypothetical protein